MISLLLHALGLVCFLGGRISGSNGSRISHSSSVRLLEYVIEVDLNGTVILSWQRRRCQMGSIKNTYNTSVSISVHRFFFERRERRKIVDLIALEREACTPIY
jgi:hypothetical protein